MIEALSGHLYYFILGGLVQNKQTNRFSNNLHAKPFNIIVISGHEISCTILEMMSFDNFFCNV